MAVSYVRTKDCRTLVEEAYVRGGRDALESLAESFTVLGLTEAASIAATAAELVTASGHVERWQR